MDESKLSPGTRRYIAAMDSDTETLERRENAYANLARTVLAYDAAVEADESSLAEYNALEAARSAAFAELVAAEAARAEAVKIIATEQERLERVKRAHLTPTTRTPN